MELQAAMPPELEAFLSTVLPATRTGGVSPAGVASMSMVALTETDASVSAIHDVTNSVAQGAHMAVHEPK
jgi:hypothetical protein